MSNISKLFSVFALVCLLAPGFAMAAPANAPNGYPGYGPGLTPEQAEMARQIFNDNYAKMDATRKALTAKRAELDAELASQNPDTARIESLSREIGELRGRMLSGRVNVRSQLESQGLPTDYYAPRPEDYNYAPPPPPPARGWHHGRGYGYHHGGRGGWGCWGGCW